MPTINETKRLAKRILLTNLLTNDHSISLTPLISGRHGIGKSQIASRIAEELGGISITIEGGTLKEGEITGIPYQYRNEEDEVEFRFLPYYAVDRIQKAERLLAEGKRKIDELSDVLRGTENIYSNENLGFKEKISLIKSNRVKPVILFFDEINRTDVSVFRELMNFILTRTINGYRLPWWVFIIAAMNPSTQNGFYTTNEMDPAQLDRFIKINVKESSDEWLTYAAEQGVDETLIRFIAENGDALSAANNGLDDDDKPEPSPRGWSMVDMILKSKTKLDSFFTADEIINEDKDINTIISAKVGGRAAAMYLSSLNDSSKLVLAEDVFSDKEYSIDPIIIASIRKQSTARNSITSKSICKWLKEHGELLSNNPEELDRSVKKIAQYMSVIDASSRLFFAQSTTSIFTDNGADIFSLIFDAFDDEMVELLQRSNMNEVLVRRGC